MTAVRPLAALESHVALIRALRNPSVGPRLIGEQGSHSSINTAPKTFADLLDAAATFVVTDAMLTEILRQMARVEFGQPLLPEDLGLFPSGYVVLPHPVIIPHDHPDDVAPYVVPRRMAAAFDAGFWLQTGHDLSVLVEGSGSEQAYKGGLMYGQSLSTGLLEQWASGADEGSVARELEWITNRAHLRHLPIYATGWAYETSWDPQYRDKDFVLTPAGEFERRFWMTLWRLLGEEVVAPVRFRRVDYRQAARGRDGVPEVVVCDLRRVRHPVTEERVDGAATILWSHRWKVRAHLRVLHRGTDRERTVTVKEYVKGPEHLPYLAKDRLYRLAR